jgi:hypothetical protein
MNHVHHDLIVAWAKGAKIQWQMRSDQPSWEDTDTPGWYVFHNYRIKPEPKPDVVLYAMIKKDPEKNQADIQHVKANRYKIDTDTCMFIFDGETGKLKDAQVLVNSGLPV